MTDLLVENKDFAYLDFKDSTITGIRLMIPDYEDVIFHYGSVKVLEDDDKDEAKIEFTYTIVHPGKSIYTIDELNDSTDFHNIMGQILNSILWARIQEEMLIKSNTAIDFK